MIASILRIVVFACAICLFGAGFLLSWRDKARVVPTYAAAVFCLIFTFLPEFQFFKGLGVEARLRETLREADSTMAELRGLLAPLSEFMFTVTARSGRYGIGMTARDRYRLVKEFESELTKLGMSEEQIEVAKKDWHRMNLLDLALRIVHPLLEAVKQKQQEPRAIMSRMQSKGPIPASDATWDAAVKRLWHIGAERQRLEDCLAYDKLDHVYRNIRQFMDTTDIFGDDEKQTLMDTNSEAFADLEFYTENKEFRRLEYWLELRDQIETGTATE